MPRTVLMIAFHYPPFRGGSGVHRALKFSKYFLDFQWKPLVVSAHPRAFPQTGSEQMQDIPPAVEVYRTFALNTAKHLSLWGSFPRILALPDPWVSWCLGAIPRCLLLIRKYKPQVLWTTYPIATAHLIGFIVNRLTGIPWVADFRDSMTEEGYPRSPALRKAYVWIEKKVMKHASKLIFTAELTKEMYVKRYPLWNISDKSTVISNGYDEEDFKSLTHDLSPNTNGQEGKVRLIHSGVIYPEERNPIPFFQAISTLKKMKIVNSEVLKIDLRGSGTEEEYQKYINQLDIADVVELLPSLPFLKSLEEGGRADSLLLFQGSNCNHQIPAKAYEYLRLGKPILALTDPRGETAGLLKECGGVTLIDMENEKELVAAIPKFLDEVRQGIHPVPSSEYVTKFSRKKQAQVLTQLFECL